MRYTIKGKLAEVWLEKQFDYEPNYRVLFHAPETTSEIIDVGIWEERECKIEKKCYIQLYDGEIACKHFVELGSIILHYPSGDKTRERVVGYYPRVLVAFNEGHCCSTGVCLDCLKEKL